MKTAQDKNSDIVLFRDLKTIPLLFVENDLCLSERDKADIECFLTGMQKGFEKLENFNIKYVFDAFGNRDTFKELEKAENIMLYTYFTGDSYSMLKNFIAMCKVNNLKNKRIFDVVDRSVLGNTLDSVKEDIELLDKEHNISLYTLPRGMFDCFTKINSEF
jgi:hypothetical protein